jgi:hypothetical protein
MAENVLCFRDGGCRDDKACGAPDDGSSGILGRGEHNPAWWRGKDIDGQSVQVTEEVVGSILRQHKVCITADIHNTQRRDDDSLRADDITDRCLKRGSPSSDTVWRCHPSSCPSAFKGSVEFRCNPNLAPCCEAGIPRSERSISQDDQSISTLGKTYSNVGLCSDLSVDRDVDTAAGVDGNMAIPDGVARFPCYLDADKLISGGFHENQIAKRVDEDKHPIGDGFIG